MNTTTTPVTSISPILQAVWLGLGTYEPGTYEGKVRFALVRMTPADAVRYLKMIDVAREIAGDTRVASTLDEVAYYDDAAIFVGPDQAAEIDDFVDEIQGQLVDSVAVVHLTSVPDDFVDEVIEPRLALRRVHAEADAIRWSAFWEYDDAPVFTAYVTHQALQSIARRILPHSFGWQSTL
jgi:hypothetical protein